MKIRDIRASAHELPIHYPLIDGPRGRRALAVCEVETEGGQTGHGLTASFLTTAVPTILRRDVLPAVQGLDARDLEAIHHRVKAVLSNRGRMTGVNLQALSCLDIALCDLIGKHAGRSVAPLLGGFRDHAPVYWTYGFGFYDADQLVELARRLVAEGNRCLKVLVATSSEGWRGRRGCGLRPARHRGLLERPLRRVPLRRRQHRPGALPGSARSQRWPHAGARPAGLRARARPGRPEGYPRRRLSRRLTRGRGAPVRAFAPRRCRDRRRRAGR